MGACDVVAAQSNAFGHGLGFAAQVRLKSRYEYSYIESAAIQIGDDVLEVSAYGAYFVNGVSDAKLPAKMGEGKYQYTLTKTHTNKHEVSFDIKIRDGRTIASIKAFKDLVSLRFYETSEMDFGDVQGIMGDFHNGTHLARDGHTIIENLDDFGQEWQVRPGQDPDLFMHKSPIQYPASKCVIRNPVLDERRRLGESISVEAATKACSDHFSTKGAVQACVYDVIATGDLEAAMAGAY